ncbi:hypothetical protein PIB30_110845, partial [Stylosanthes scabra]|nr:hypothetical protein [Stylosanthes scabra]
MLQRHSYPVLPCSWLPPLLIHLASTKSHSRYNMSVTQYQPTLTTIPTYMRYFQRICVANSASTPFNPLPVHYSHAYAYNPTHMRGTHIQNSISHYPPTPRRPCLRLGVLLPLTTASVHFLFPILPRICVGTIFAPNVSLHTK